jgi:hypothetical protein
MSAEILLLKDQSTVGQIFPQAPRKVRRFPIEVVVGRVDAEQRRIPSIKQDPTSHQARSDRYTLSDVRQAQRLGQFIDAFIGERSGRFRNSIAFGAFMKADMRFNDAFPRHITPAQRYNIKGGTSERVNSNALQPGVLYVAQDNQHVAMGIGWAGYSLSVWGDYGPLVISRNVDMLTVYEASHFTKITGRICLGRE